MGRGFTKGVIAGTVAAVLILGVATAFAGTGVGAVFNLGQLNSVNQTSRLTGNSAGAMLKVKNTNPAAGSFGVAIEVGAGRPPLQVNSNARIPLLNADLLDGRTATDFLRNQAPLSLTGSGPDPTILGMAATSNGLQGTSAGAGASGVYGENTGGGFGVAGRSNEPNGVGVFGEALGTGGFAGRFSGDVRVNGDTDLFGDLDVSSSAKVDNLNADMLDGVDSGGFVRGPGEVRRGAIALTPLNGVNFTVLQVDDFFRIGYLCPDPVSNNGVFRLNNRTGEPINVFFDNGGITPEYVQMAAGNVADRFAHGPGEHVSIQIHSPSRGIANIELYSVHRASDCHIQAHATIAR
jgi:hypothetical protein